jgi:hypothetical protein
MVLGNVKENMCLQIGQVVVHQYYGSLIHNFAACHTDKRISVRITSKHNDDDNNNNNNNNNNKPDIVIRDYEKGACMLLDVAIPGDINVIQKEAEKILKYKDLTLEIQRM